MINRFWRPTVGRVFLSYRRQDAQWFAGRLADSLAAYFGDKRVFRDIEGIAGGADFAAVISESLTSSDAVIVVIGKDWVNARDDQGNRRLDNADDWVAQELVAAMSKGLPVFPVLVEDTQMPRADELPQSLRPLARYNAISVSDSRWEGDTARLAKIVSLDIPSVTERRLQLQSLVISTLLVLAMVFELSVFLWNLLQGRPELVAAAAGQLPSLLESRLPYWSWSQSSCGTLANTHAQLYQLLQLVPTKAQGASVFVVMSLGSAWMLTHGRYVDASGRRPYYAAAWVGAIGSLAVFGLFYPVCPDFETILIFYFGLVIAMVMLGCLSLSGFKAK